MPYLDVDTFLWWLLQLTLIYVDYTVLKGQAVDGDAVPPRSCLQAPIHMLRQPQGLCPYCYSCTHEQSRKQVQDTGAMPLQGCTTGLPLQVENLAKVACSKERFWVRIRKVIAACARVEE